MRNRCFLLLLFFLVGTIKVQQVLAQAVPARALTNIVIHHHDGSVQQGSLVWRGTKIEAIGPAVTIPFDAKVTDGGDSLHVYPGFINGFSTMGSPDVPSNLPRAENPGSPGYERAGIQPHRHPSHVIDYSSSQFTAWQKTGFTSAAIGLKGFMLPGQIDFLSINEDLSSEHVLKKGVGLSAQFESSQGVYPSTLMGIMAQFRQLWFDAEAHLEHKRLYSAEPNRFDVPAHRPVLDAFQPVMRREQPVFFLVDSKEDIERAIKLSEELGFSLIIVSGKEAWRIADRLKNKSIPVLVSLDLPEKPSWMKEDNSDEEITEEQSRFRERQEKSWIQWVTNTKFLLDQGVLVGFASASSSQSDFFKNLKIIHENGVSEAEIVRLITANTAQIIGVSNSHGTLRVGHTADFTVFSKPLLDSESKVLKSVSNGILTTF